MKSIILLLVIVIAMPPLQAGYCDLDTRHANSHQMKQHDEGDHKCCDSDRDDSSTGYDRDMACGFCYATVPAVPEVYLASSTAVQHHSQKFLLILINSRYAPPPHRPPIS